MSKLKYILGALIIGAVILGANYARESMLNPTVSDKDVACAELGGAAAQQGKVEVPHSPYFPKIDFYNIQSNDHLTILTHFKTRQQSTEYSCGNVCAMMVEEYLTGKTTHKELEIAQIMKTSKTTGTTIKGMARYFNKLGWKVQSSASDKTPDTYEQFLSWVSTNLKANTPIIVENVEFGGHYRVIIGLDTMGTKGIEDDVLIMADPYDTTDHHQDGYMINSAERFFYMWFDHQLFARDEQKRPWIIAKPQ